MMRGPTLVAPATAVAELALPAPASAALRWGPCEGDGHGCARLHMPLDHSGAVSGSVPLHVVRERPFGRLQEEDGVTLLVGGDAGESTTAQFAVTDLVDTVRNAARRNRVVILDLRGTGGSGSLRCRDLESATATDLGREAEACAARGRIGGERVRAHLTLHLRLLDALGVGARASAARDRPGP